MPLGNMSLFFLLFYCGDVSAQAERDIPVRSITYRGSYIFRDSAVLSRRLHIDYYDGPDELGEYYRISYKGFVCIGVPGPVFKCHPDSMNCPRDSVSLELKKIRT